MISFLYYLFYIMALSRARLVLINQSLFTPWCFSPLGGGFSGKVRVIYSSGGVTALWDTLLGAEHCIGAELIVLTHGIVSNFALSWNFDCNLFPNPLLVIHAQIGSHECIQ